MNAKLIIGLILIAGFLGLGVFSFLDLQVPSVTFASARDSDQTVQVNGVIDFESVDYEVENKRLVFEIYDSESARLAQNGNPEKLRVIFYGEVPGNFEQATSVTVIGKAGEDGFVAENMLVKCPSKYQGEDPVNPDEVEYEVRSYPSST